MNIFNSGPNNQNPKTYNVQKPDEEWRKELTPEQYHITREKGTEKPFSGEHWNRHEDGIYRCGNCGIELFDSNTKFDSGTGWPSFSDPMNAKNIELREDNSHFMKRTEVVCANCGAHLGHLFDDGPTLSGNRYCMNSCALKFDKKPEGSNSNNK